MSKQQTWVYGTEQYEKAKGCPEHKKRKYNPFLRKSGSLCKGCIVRIHDDAVLVYCHGNFSFSAFLALFFFRIWNDAISRLKKLAMNLFSRKIFFYAFLFYLEVIFKDWTSMTSLVAFSNFNQLAKYVPPIYLGMYLDKKSFFQKAQIKVHGIILVSLSRNLHKVIWLQEGCSTKVSYWIYVAFISDQATAFADDEWPKAERSKIQCTTD